MASAANHRKRSHRSESRKGSFRTAPRRTYAPTEERILNRMLRTGRRSRGREKGGAAGEVEVGES